MPSHDIDSAKLVYEPLFYFYRFGEIRTQHYTHFECVDSASWSTNRFYSPTSIRTKNQRFGVTSVTNYHIELYKKLRSLTFVGTLKFYLIQIKII